MIDAVRGLLAHLSRRELTWLGLAALVALVGAGCSIAGGASAQAESQTATAKKGNLVVSVGGVGRIVEATPTIQVYPQTSGQVSRLLVSPGEHVVAGQQLAVLDDGGSASAASEQAGSDLATAQLQLRQQRAARPVDMSSARLEVKRARADLETLLGGTPAARQQATRLAELSVQLAQKRIDQLLAPPSLAEVRAAEAELKRAEAALAALLKPAPAPLPEVLAAAQQAVVVARQNLARAQATGTPSEISAAQLELYRAQAELAALQQPAPAPLLEDVAAANAAVESAKENLQKLYGPPNPADVQAARLELERARLDLRLLRAGPSSTARASALEAVTSARGKLAQTASPLLVDLARQNVVAARVRLAAARSAEGLLAIRTPAAGVVSALSVAVGASVDPTKSIATIASLDQLAASVDLSEFDVAQVKQGQRAIVSVDALGGEPYSGTVIYVPPTGTDTNGVVTFPVQIGLRSAEDVKPGMNVSVRIIVAQREDVVQVPLEAVQTDEEDNTFVTVVDESGQETDRPVTLGLSNNKNAEIVKGLSAGEDVVLPEVQAQQEEE